LQAHQGQPPVFVKHERKNKHDLQQVSCHCREAFAKNIGQRFNVGDCSRDQPPDGGTVEEPKPQADDVFIQLRANVADNLLAQPTGDISVNVLCDGLHEQQADEQNDHEDHAIIISGCYIVVKRVLYEHRAQWGEHSENDRQDDHRSKSETVRLDKGQQPSQYSEIDNISAADLFFLHYLPDFFDTNTDLGYVTRFRKSPCGGAFAPALRRSLLFIMPAKSATDRLPLPTSSKVPTRALTMPLRKRFAVILNVRLVPLSFQSADLTSQIK